ncbi:MAG TPA: hypothetical protein VFF30_04350 [Nitrososphaerales archaeon]|nr:hypothetical protein [Nitrososphaerales archaeon]
MSWPVGVNVGGQGGGVQEETSTIQPGVLSVNLTSQMSFIPTPLQNQPTGINSSAPSVSGVRISITAQGSLTPLMVGATAPDGSYKILLAPGDYIVGIVNNAFDNLSVPLQIFESRVTHLNALLNLTNFHLASFNAIESDSSDWLGSWDTIYALVPINQSIPSGAGVRDFLSISTQGSVPSTTAFTHGSVRDFFSTLIPATIDSQASGISGTHWVQLHINGQASINAITGLSLVTTKVSYTVAVSDY